MYTYDPVLTPAENRRRAIVAHTHDGPMVAVEVQTPSGSYTSHWLFPTGATLANEPGAHVVEPQEEPPEGYEHLRGDAWVQAQRNRREYWRIRTLRAAKEFESSKEKALRGTPSDSDIGLLARLQREVLTCREKLHQADLELRPPQTVPRALTDEEITQLQREREQEREARARVQAIGIGVEGE
jgi:hypothetical protein